MPRAGIAVSAASLLVSRATSDEGAIEVGLDAEIAVNVGGLGAIVRIVVRSDLWSAYDPTYGYYRSVGIGHRFFPQPCDRVPRLGHGGAELEGRRNIEISR